LINVDPSAGSGRSGSGVTRLTNNLAWDFDPSCSPDGTRIAFVSNRDGNSNLRDGRRRHLAIQEMMQ